MFIFEFKFFENFSWKIFNCHLPAISSCRFSSSADKTAVLRVEMMFNSNSHRSPSPFGNGFSPSLQPMRASSRNGFANGCHQGFETFAPTSAFPFAPTKASPAIHQCSPASAFASSSSFHLREFSHVNDNQTLPMSFCSPSFSSSLRLSLVRKTSFILFQI